MAEPIDDGPETQRAASDDGGTPRWVRVSIMIAAAVVLLIGVLLLQGGHGPGRHSAPPGSDHTSPAAAYP
ncbi:MAG: hypothetical protein K0R20_1498 [Actinomycetia bacterium]|jgi:hypothetical protein|nr:hypothetical protein [Actinomycetes bacterium]